MSNYRVYRLLIILCISAWCYPAKAAALRADSQPPLLVKEYERWVDSLVSEANGNPALLASKLQAFGFTCTPSDAVYLRCVRFGCQKLAGMFWRGALLQWSVNEFQGKFDRVAFSYSWAKGCYPPERVEQEQKRFVLQ
ncbi:hypothetical protein HJB79_26955 [Rhizobium lentis]|uniref:hypothetical protein n=1 Tax=Rhizobium TaxID=379 RepID=UPI0016213292|nr:MULTISPECIES: hypothetical protein [Rhizobium]MBB3353741.1 hypothetical protein [Rhizobium sp. BK049]MBX5136661.1 hypothetical protein [Rhizobium lentis]MBX5142364.1 hypothetical protein [Rhizobium lentis]